VACKTFCSIATVNSLVCYSDAESVSLRVLLTQSAGSDSLPSVLPSSTGSDDTASDEKTSVVQNHVKRLSDPGNDDQTTTDNSLKDAAAENKTQSAKKKGKGQLKCLKKCVN